MNEWVPLIGLVVQTLLILLGGYSMVIRADTMTKALKEEVKAMKDQLQGLASIITTQAVHSERMNNMSVRVTLVEQRIEDLRRGRGYVQDRVGVDTVDREYPG